MAKAIQIAANTQGLFVLLDDGTINQYQIAQGTWTTLPMFTNMTKRDRVIETEVMHRNLPNGYHLWRDGETMLWKWRKGAVESPIFSSDEEAVTDAKQKQLLATLPTQPGPG